MTKLNKVFLGFGIALAIIGVFIFSKQPESVIGGAKNVDIVYMTKGGGSSTVTAPATTTAGVTFLAAAATTTFPFYSERSDLVTLDIQMTASTSAGALVLTYETSNTDGLCHSDPNSCTWSNPSLVASGIVASTTPTYTWRPDGALNATSTLSFQINPVASKFVRVKASVTGSAAALWISAARRIEQI